MVAPFSFRKYLIYNAILVFLSIFNSMAKRAFESENTIRNREGWGSGNLKWPWKELHYAQRNFMLKNMEQTKFELNDKYLFSILDGNFHPKLTKHGDMYSWIWIWSKCCLKSIRSHRWKYWESIWVDHFSWPPNSIGMDLSVNFNNVANTYDHALTNGELLSTLQQFLDKCIRVGH